MRILRVLGVIGLIVLAAALRAADAPFVLAADGRAAEIWVDEGDFKVVHIAARDLAADVRRVSGSEPRVVLGEGGRSRDLPVVIAGTLGRSALIDALAREGKFLKAGQFAGAWESFVIATVEKPFPGVPRALVIAGSDRRGTAFGLYEISELIGVSPWSWWADVTPEPRARVELPAGLRREGPPSVKYRGVFLNDEDWGLQPWAAKTFEPEVGDIGPKTYAKLFELMLRLKANTVWPAMHECTTAFNLVPGNAQTADDYAIVMGSSHAEPMLRNNVGEWKAPKDDFNYVKNRDGVLSYWDERVATNGKFESIFTLGMRGIHDSAIVGPKTQKERIAVLEDIFAQQRAMIAKHVSPDVEKVPQIFCPYKEVLDDYRAGLRVPDDVTIVYPDDNFGYIRQFPNAEERKRAGGFGVYYHLSYLGRPLSYLWLNTTPPALIWSEMSKAYDHGARQLWVLNVGDLKPGEIGTEFFLQMAWDATRWNRENLPQFLVEWATREFGAEHAKEIAGVMDDFYRLGFARKPEHLQWFLPRTERKPTVLNPFVYGDEIAQRLGDYAELRARAERVGAALPAAKRDAFYQLVTYPVRGAALANERYFANELSGLYATQGRASARLWAERSRAAGAAIAEETRYFNETLAGGKWRGMMSVEMKKGQWPSFRLAPLEPPTALAELKTGDTPTLGVAIEGRAEPLKDGEAGELADFVGVRGETRFVDVFNSGVGDAAWTATASEPWIRLSVARGDLRADGRILVSVDDAKLPPGGAAAGEITVTGAGRTVTVWVRSAPAASERGATLPGGERVFVESRRVVSIEAENFSGRKPASSAASGSGAATWEVIPGLGRTGDTVSVFPTTMPGLDAGGLAAGGAPVLEYRVRLRTAGEARVMAFLLPTHEVASDGRGLRYAVSLGDGPWQTVVVGAKQPVSSNAWAFGVMDNAVIGESRHAVAAPGEFTLRVAALDAGVVLDKLVIDLGGLAPSYLGPSETRAK